MGITADYTTSTLASDERVCLWKVTHPIKTTKPEKGPHIASCLSQLLEAEL